MRQDATVVAATELNDESKVSLGEMAVAIGWTLTASLFGFAIAGLAALFMI